MKWIFLIAFIVSIVPANAQPTIFDKLEKYFSFLKCRPVNYTQYGKYSHETGKSIVVHFDSVSSKKIDSLSEIAQKIAASILDYAIYDSAFDYEFVEVRIKLDSEYTKILNIDTASCILPLNDKIKNTYKKKKELFPVQDKLALLNNTTFLSLECNMFIGDTLMIGVRAQSWDYFLKKNHGLVAKYASFLHSFLFRGRKPMLLSLELLDDKIMYQFQIDKKGKFHYQERFFGGKTLKAFK